MTELANINFKMNDGTDARLADWNGDVVLLVNVASKCGLTKQYEGLEALYRARSGDGLVVLGFPANDFKEQEPGSDAEAALGRAHEAAFGAALQTMTTPAYLDARVYALYNRVPTLCYGPISRNIHGFDEYVSLDSLRSVTKAMALFIADWCGTEPV